VPARAAGTLPLRRSFVDAADGAVVSAFRRSAADAYEARLFECEGSPRRGAFAGSSLPLAFEQAEAPLGAWEVRTLAGRTARLLNLPVRVEPQQLAVARSREPTAIRKRQEHAADAARGRRYDSDRLAR
jgi:hypothetical protein